MNLKRGIYVDGWVDPSGFWAHVNPHATVWSTASAGVGNKILSAGVSGQLNLINTYMPMNVSVALKGTPKAGGCDVKLSGFTQGDFYLGSLSGKLDLYAKIKTKVFGFWPVEKDFRKYIAKWNDPFGKTFRYGA